MSIERFNINFSSSLSASVEVHVDIDLLKKWQQHDAKRSDLPPFVCDESRCLIKRIRFLSVFVPVSTYFFSTERDLFCITLNKHQAFDTKIATLNTKNVFNRPHKNCLYSLLLCCFLSMDCEMNQNRFFLHFSSRWKLKLVTERWVNVFQRQRRRHKNESRFFKNIYYLLFWAME